MIPQTVEKVRAIYPTAREESDHSVTFDCPICEAEGHPNKQLKLYANGALSCSRFASAGKEANREHCKPVREALGLNEGRPPTFISEVLFDGKVTLEVSPADRGKQRVVARNCDSTLARDVFDLNHADRRAKFAGGLRGLDESQRAEVVQALIQMCDRFEIVQAVVEDEEADEEVNVEFVALSDGRLVEQMARGFAVYDPESRAATFQATVKHEGVIYRPYEDGTAVKFADTLVEYGTEAELDAAIEAYIYRNLDLSPRDQKLAARYARFSYVADKVLELPYLRPIGPRGNGKSRYIHVVGRICYRPLVVVSPSPASIYRLIDRYHCTLAIDEMNRADDGDTAEIIRILNSGNQKGNLIPRAESGPNGSFVVKTYDPYGPKVVASLKRTESNAFESRCVPAEMEVTKRNDIKLRLSERLLAEQADLRAKLTLWRLRNWSRDYEDLLDQAEAELRRYSRIEPRFVQIAIPLFAMIDDPKLKAEFAGLLETRTEADSEERRESFDGELVTAIHSLLFEEADGEGGQYRCRWRLKATVEDSAGDVQTFEVPRPEQGKVCEAALVDQVTRIINRELPERQRHDSKWLAKQIRKLGLTTEKIKRRGSSARDKRAVVFDRQALARLFKLFSLPVPPDFDGPNGPSPVCGSKDSGLGGAIGREPGDGDSTSWPQANRSQINELQGWGHWGQENSGNPEETYFETDFSAGGGDYEEGSEDRNEAKKERGEAQADERDAAAGALGRLHGLTDAPGGGGGAAAHWRNLPDPRIGREPQGANPGSVLLDSEAQTVEHSVVALDTETEPFDAKRGVTHRNARMIGLALCYDGEKADYVTDQEAWLMMMPESEQTVVYHNGKFDRGVKERAGLPLTGKWEDTLIAAHLLDENGAHGLKALAKEHLGVGEPLTFEEADRMRLLDPEVFDEYARNDARYTFRLWQQFEPEIDRQGLRRVYELEKAILPVVMRMERAGMKIDLPTIKTLSAEVEAECGRTKAEIFEHAGCQFDLNSPQKVAAILYDKLGVPSTKTTDGGRRSVDAESLKDVRGYHPAVDAILRFREIDKLASCFLKTLPGFADEGGRIHPEFKSLGAKTGRFSCSDPNVQQIPARSELGKKLRRAFIAEPGHQLVVADYGQMELRVLAHYSQDPLLLEAYTSGHDTDLHTLTASRMFRKAESEVSKPERTVAKMINFGIAYGITPIGLFNRLRPQGADVTEAQCGQFIEDYFRTYPKVGEFLGKAERAVKDRGYVRSLFGRRRRVSGDNRREIRQAQNFIIQATAADIAKDAMVRLHAVLPYGARLIAMVHDEFIVECRDEQAEEVTALVVGVMQQAPAGFTVPLAVEAKAAGNWGDAK